MTDKYRPGKSLLHYRLNTAFTTITSIISSHFYLDVLATWLGGIVVRELDSRSRGREFDPAATPLPDNNSGQVVHTDVPLSPSSIIWYRPNRRGVNGHTARCTGPVSSVFAVFAV